VHLQVGDNKLTGSIRTEIGIMKNLTRFVLGASNMNGFIPAELYSLTQLEVLQLHNSSFSGVLSEAEFGQLSNLRGLWLQNNKFSGAIPIVAIENMTNLEELILYGNQLTGSISAPICDQRGFEEGRISILRVDCSITCPKHKQGCCDEC
jgi:hypothetical protein